MLALYPVSVRCGYRYFAIADIVGVHPSSRVVQWGLAGDKFLVKIMLRERESVQEGVRRFRKLVERTGLKRELRRRERYEKPSDVKRKAKTRAIRKSKTQS